MTRSNLRAFPPSQPRREGGAVRGLMARLGRFLVWAPFLAATACTQFTWEVGQKPNLDALETGLDLGSSTREEVRATLGQPAGEGAIMMPHIDPKSRQMWTYYYDKGRVDAGGQRLHADARRMILMVYFDDGVYDGYQWFSTLPEHAL